MRTFIAIVIVLLLILGIWLYSISQQISFKSKIIKIDLKNIFKSKFAINLDLIIKNKSNTTITIGKLYLQFFYKGKLIGSTPKTFSETLVKANAETTIKGLVLDIMLNKESGEVVAKYQNKEPIDFDIKIKIRLFGFPISFKTKYKFSDYE